MKPTAPALSLDIPLEKRHLLVAIARKEKELSVVQAKIDRLGQELAGFEQIYDRRVRRLYQRLDDLEEQLFKFRNLSDVVDDIFSFSEAEEVYEETMKSRRARLQDEYERQHTKSPPMDRKTGLAPADRAELKRLYRKLAHRFHPDRMGGNDKLMKLINKAYAEGNLTFLRDFESRHLQEEPDTATLHGLKTRLAQVMQLIENANRELQQLRRSDMYILRRNLSKTNRDQETMFDVLIRKIRKDIARKEEQLADLKKDVGLT